MNSKQFAWAYMVQHGLANMKKACYGGYDIVDKKAVGGVKESIHYRVSYNDAFIKMIKAVGVDWRKTNAPQTDTESIFTDTFHDPEQVQVLNGVLVLKNGYKQTWVAEPLTASVFDTMTMAMIDEFTAKYVEIFGEE